MTGKVGRQVGSGDGYKSLDEFKGWLKAFDKDNDGRLSQKELADAFATAGAWFPNWKAMRALQAVDSDGNGFVDGNEINNLRVLMAIKSAPVGGKHEMTVEQFKRWIKAFDTDKDGRISGEELAEAIHVSGGWFANWRGKRGLRAADSNHNGFVDESEFDNLVEFAQKRLGVKIITP